MVGDNTPVKVLGHLIIAFPTLKPRNPIPRLEIMRVLARKLCNDTQRLIQAMGLDILLHFAQSLVSIQFLGTRRG
jgi:hypothetical protein